MGRPEMLRAARCLAATILLSTVHLFVSAQSTAPSTQRANELFEAKKWAEAADVYEAIVKADPDNAKAWYQLASARYWLGQYAQAAAAFQKNISLAKNATAMFNLACVYARMNEKEKALDLLGKAFAPDSKSFAYLQYDLNDPDLSSLRDDQRYKELWLAVDKKRNPCMYSVEARQFDFWIGEWDVYNPTGRKDGTSVIQRIANGCGILENWTGAIGGSGKSINFYDPQVGKWFQYWIGADGNPQRFSGVYRNGAIRYEGGPSTLNGKSVLRRLTFFNVDANTIRQLAEQSDDDGKTWTIGYDYKYVRQSQTNNNLSNR
jgi:tetratricopeptide (TPR) repeat protein